MTTLALSSVAFVRRDPDWVFRELHDPQTLIGCVPGASLCSVTGPGSFHARIAIGLGPIHSHYDGTGRIVASNPASRTASLEVTSDPQAAPATLRVRMSMAVIGQGTGAEIRMTFEVGISGAAWLLSPSWIEPVACDLVDRTARRMQQRLEAAPIVPLPPAA